MFYFCGSPHGIRHLNFVYLFVCFCAEHCSQSPLQQSMLSQWGAARCLAQARYCFSPGLVDGRLEFMKPEPWKGPLSGCVRVLLLHGHRWLRLQPKISPLCAWSLGRILCKNLSHISKGGNAPHPMLKSNMPSALGNSLIKMFSNVRVCVPQVKVDLRHSVLTHQLPLDIPRLWCIYKKKITIIPLSLVAERYL